MFRSVCERRVRGGVIAGLLVAIAAAQGLEAQERGRILSSEISVSRNEAALRLELDDGRTVDLALRGGRAFLEGSDIGTAPRGGELDRVWRELLGRAMDAPTAELPALLSGWSPSDGGDVARALDRALEDAVAGLPLTPPEPPQAPGAAPISDSLNRLVDRIGQLEAQLEELERLEDPRIRVRDVRTNAIPVSRGPFYRLWRGIEGVISLLLTGAVLFGVAFATIFFGGRRYIEGVADTARTSTTRSLLVGLAAMFLVIPAYVLGMIALAISIVGIPALLLWIPLFPVAVVLAAVLGYLGVAHAAGEALAERRFSGTDWFRRGNSYYFLISGIGLLMSLFIAARIVSITGIDFFTGMLMGIGAVVTWAAVSIGLGAVLLSRGGSRPPAGGGAFEPEMYAEERNA